MPEKLYTLNHALFFCRFWLLAIIFASSISSFFLNLSIGTVLFGQPDKYPYERYENRKEGIIKKRQLVSGDKLVLFSAMIENLELEDVEPKPETYQLGFYLKNPSQVKVEVKEHFDVSKDFYYKMTPLSEEDYSKGFNSFAWPSAIPLYYHLILTELYPLARIYNSGEDIIVPTLLFYEKPQNLKISYRFGFIPYRTINTLEFKIYNIEEERLVYTGAQTDLPGEKIAYIRWEGNEQTTGEIAKDGYYMLFLEANFKPRPGSPGSRPVTFKYSFYHKRNLF